MKGPRSVAAFPLSVCQQQLLASLSAHSSARLCGSKAQLWGKRNSKTKYDRPTHFCTFKQ